MEQKNEMRKLADLVNKTLKEVENQKNTVKGKLIERIIDLGPTENEIKIFIDFTAAGFKWRVAAVNVYLSQCRLYLYFLQDHWARIRPNFSTVFLGVWSY